ncbi:MAG: helix-hairpin-helix domain-containing protein, partial [Brevinematales bacterium]
AASLDENGKFLSYFLFFQNNRDASIKAIKDAVLKYNIALIAVGNGTGSHEVQEVVAGAITEYSLPVEYTVVSEDGASVYSASDIAIEEFPELDLTIRGAISIGRRIQDPLAEFVKIDPKSIGVGLYQHDVNQKALSESLTEVVESVVNNVGVNLNTASIALLRYVSGVSTTLSRNIVSYRDSKGLILSRDDLMNIPGFGDKTFEQAAGFLKIPESAEELDNTWVHPENYAAARQILGDIKANKEISREKRLELINKYGMGETTVKDIIDELKKPNRDPREGYPAPVLQKEVVKFEDLKPGMPIKGKVKNVVDFGAFVDVGIKETALIHISEFSDNYVKNPMDVLKVGDIKDFKIIDIDPVRKRISLSLKKNSCHAEYSAAKGPSPAARPSSYVRNVAARAPKEKEPVYKPAKPQGGTIGSFLKKPLTGI